MNLELIRTVYNDLVFIRDSWKDVSDDDLRRGSTILRGLLMHGNLSKAWREIGFSEKCLITANSVSNVIDTIPHANIEIVSAGGALYQGIQTSGASLFVNFTSIDQIPISVYRKRKKTVNLGNYQNMVVLFTQGVQFTRKDIIEFVANKLGGAHFDTTRTKKLKILEDASKRITYIDKQLIYFELLSTGQFLVNSDGLCRFIERCEQILPHAGYSLK